MQRRIFLSYRREDSAGQSGRIRDRLVRDFGKDYLFMDVDGIPLGTNFIKRLNDEVASCDVLLAVIGKQWIELRDERGHRRLDNPHDFVRIEISAALQRDIPLIPILLDGTKIPSAELLPDNMKELAVRNALDVRHASFHADLDRLVGELKRIVPGSTGAISEALLALVVSALAVLGAWGSVHVVWWLTHELLKIWFPEGEKGLYVTPNLFRGIYLMTAYVAIAGCGSLAAVIRFRNFKKLFWIAVGAFSYFLVLGVCAAIQRYDIFSPMVPVLGVAVSIGILGTFVFVRRIKK